MTMVDDPAPGRRRELDPEVVRAFREGDQRALAAVYDRYSGAVWTVAMRVLGDTALAEDAAQEAFLRAWRAAGTVDPDRGLGSWLLTIARRCAVDVLRRESRPTQGGHADEQDLAQSDPGLDQVWESWQVRCALDGLAPQEREVVRLAHYEGLTQSEIAGTLGIALGTVKSRSARAHRKLAGLLDHLREPPGDPSPPRTKGA